jgi:hypothetical protein
VVFEAGMKIEAVDRRNPILVRVATVKEVKDHQVLVHFDNWDDMYDYWVDDDSSEIKPPYWCARTSNPNLQPPPLRTFTYLCVRFVCVCYLVLCVHISLC